MSSDVLPPLLARAIAGGGVPPPLQALFGGARHGRAEVLRLEALASWTESLRDTIAGAVGLEQAIPASYNAAAPILKPPLALLIDRLHTREPLPDALIRFGDDLDDPG